MRSLFTRREARGVSSRGFDLVYKSCSDLGADEMDRLRDLYLEVYGDRIGRSPLITTLSAGLTEALSWKLNCAGRRPAEIVLAYHSSRLVGQAAVLPHRATVMGEESCVGQALESMVAPDHRKQGLFTEMSKYLYQQLSPDISLMYAFPQNDYRPAMDLGWKPIYETPWYEKEVHACRCSGRISLEEAVDGRFDALWQKVRARFSCSLARDADYLRWRFLRNPLENYRIAVAANRSSIEGYAVWKNQFGQGQIVDTLATSSEVQMDLLCSVENVLDREGVRSMAMLVPRDWVLLRAAMSCGMVPASKTTCLMTYPAALLPAGLYVQMGDGGIF